jgi:N-acetylglutamate synthase-like GNAT family acetyltransferase
MIRPCDEKDFPAIFEIVNDAARAYRGVIPEDRWHEPYMPMEELKGQVADGVKFLGWEEDGQLEAVMGIQDVQDVALIRHAYIRSASRRKGLGGLLIQRLLEDRSRPVLVGTWAAATWAVKFYEKHGFIPTDKDEKDRLLKKYWKIPERQVETSVVLRLAKI